MYFLIHSVAYEDNMFTPRLGNIVLPLVSVFVSFSIFMDLINILIRESKFKIL